jgi:hypothetical protein
MSTPRSTQIETEKRVFTVQGWILNGVQDYLILKNIEQQYGVGRRQAKNLLQKAYKIWHEDQEATMDQKRSLRIAELKQLARSMSESDKKTPRGIVALMSVHKEINKLEALYPARVHLVKGDSENPILFTEEFSADKEARLNLLIEKALLSKKN